MLTARIQAIDGTRTFTPLDSQPCRLLHGPVTHSPSLGWLCQPASSALLSSADAAQVKGLLAFTPVGLPPTEHVYLFWTHSFAKTPAGFKISKIPQRLVTCRSFRCL